MSIHNHSSFSTLDGFGNPADHVRITKEKGIEAYALTDHKLTAGWYKAEEACIKEGIKFLPGVESYFAEDRFDKNKNALFGMASPHLLLLAKDQDGMKSVSTLVYHSYYEGFYNNPRCDFDLLRKHNKGVICTTGCVSSPVGKFLQMGDYQRARNWITEAQEIFGDDFYFEVQPHDFPEQKNQNKFLASIDPDILVASVDAHYPTPEDRDVQFVSVCVGTKSTLADPALTYDNDHSIKSYEEILESLQKTGGLSESQAITAVENSKLILSNNNVILPKGLDLAPGWDNAKEELKEAANKGLQSKVLPIVKTQDQMNVYLNRLKYEYNIICDKGFAEYFMVTKDMVDAARERGVVVGPGRGSSSGSLLSYLIGITAVDPIKWGLDFERFLSPDRGGYQMAFHDPNEIADLIDFYDQAVDKEYK